MEGLSLLDKITLAFNPDQERDENGKWTSGGGEPKTGKVDSSEIKLGADLSGRNLSGMDLSDASLSGANLTNAILSDANLYGASLRKANLTDAILYGAHLPHANLTDAILSDANLTSAKLAYADLTGAEMTGANLDTANLFAAYLDHANLAEADLTNATLTNAVLTHVSLRDANLTDAVFTGANLRYADLTGAIIDGATFVGADTYGAIIPQAESSNRENKERLEAAEESAQFSPDPTLGSFSTHELSFDELMQAINDENEFLTTPVQTYLKGAGRFTEGADPEALKKSVEDQIRESADFSATSGIDGDSLRTPRSYTDAWQNSSNSTKEAEMIQESASRVLLDQEADHPKGWDDNYKGTSAQAELVVFEMYQRTQKELADVGYKPDDTVTLFRGIRDTDGLSLRPLSSWSLQPSVAQNFSGDNGSIFVADVQVANIVSLPTTGFGCYDESEVIVLSKGADNLTAAFNPDQERDENGKWTSGGGEPKTGKVDPSEIKPSADLNNRDLSDMDLSGIDLRNAQLFEAVLRDANLTDAKMAQANLSYANLIRANLTDADLYEADLPHAKLAYADLTRVNAENANLTDVYLNGANLQDANLRNADLNSADLTGANLDGVILDGAILFHTNFSGVDLTNVDLTNVDLGNAYLEDAILPESVRTNANGDLLEKAIAQADFDPKDIENFDVQKFPSIISSDWKGEFSPNFESIAKINTNLGFGDPNVSPEELKIEVEKQIENSASFSKNNSPFDSILDARGYTDSWQMTANDGRNAEMIQESASRVLLGQEASLPADWSDRYKGQSTQAELVVFEMYQRTQAKLADAGYKPDDTLTLYRGVEDSEIALRPLSSWTTDPSVAVEFANVDGSIFTAKVPIANIVATPVTGFGCYNEYEVIVATPNSALTAAFNPDQERDENGRWTSSGETTDKEAEKIVNAVLQNEGYSVKPLTGEVPMSGYMVAVPNTSHVVSSEDFFNKQNTDKVADSLDDFMEKHEAAFDDGAWLGLWYSKETSEIVYDVVDQIENREEAVAQGVARDQISIYDVVNGVEIQTGGTGGLTASGQARSFHNSTGQEMVGNDLGRKTNMDSFGSRAFRRGSKQTLAFNPDQPRDADGKWASGSTSEPKTGKVDPSEIVPNADLSERDLLGMDLSGMDLTGINFTGARLYHANLSGANLSGADLNGANLSSADLTAADLTNADLTNAKLNYANLHEADLINANLTGADLTGTIINKADLNSADLSGAIGISPSIEEANSKNESLLAEAKATINTDGIKDFDTRIIYEESPVSTDDAVRWLTSPPKEGSPEWRLWENQLDRSPIDLKMEVEDQIAASAVFSTSHQTNESLLTPREYADTWADNSNDNRQSEAIQESASRVLLNQEAPLPEGWEDHYKGQSDQVELVMLKMYERTQSYLSDQGYKEDDTLTLYRGVQMEFGDRPPSWEVDTPLQLRPLSSWSTDFEVSRGFLKDNGYILEAEVPITNIVSLPMTGLGCLDEKEVVVGRPNSQSTLDNITAAFNPDQERDENGRWTSGGGTDTETFLGRDGSEKIANIADPDMARYARTNADLIRENTPKSGYEGDTQLPSDENFKRNDWELQQIASRTWAATFQQCEDITIAADNLLGFATQDREWSDDVQFGDGSIDTNAPVYAQEMLDALTETVPNESYESALFNIKENWDAYGLEKVLVGENTDLPYAMRGINNNTGFMDSLDLAFQEKENVGWSLASFVPAGDFAARMRSEISEGMNDEQSAISIAKGFQSPMVSDTEPERVGLIHLTNGSALAVSTDSFEIVTGGEFKIVDRLTGPQATDYLENLAKTAADYGDDIGYSDQTVYVMEQVALPDYERGD